MWRRVGRDDLLSINPISPHRGLHYPFSWPVHDDYRVIDSGQEEPYLLVTSTDAATPARTYEPLRDTPYLYLQFARLAESKDRERVLTEWLSTYGLLGLHRNRHRYFREGLPEVQSFSYRASNYTSSVIPAFELSSRGGPGETLDAVRREIVEANRVLTCYEAALSRNEDKLEAALMSNSPSSVEDLRAYCRLRMDESGSSRIDVLVHLATQSVFWTIQEVLEQFAYPCISVDLETRDVYGPDVLYTPDHFYRSWYPRNLLGALYIQAYWLVTSVGELSKCKCCGRVISYAASFPNAGDKAKRKPRRDKEYCDSRCRQNYHYHNRVKPTHKD